MAHRWSQPWACRRRGRTCTELRTVEWGRVVLAPVARLFFEIEADFDLAPQQLWESLIDWKDHESWVPSTSVELHSQGGPPEVGDEFTAWTGPFPTTAPGRKLCLQDRMVVEQLDFDPDTQSGECRVGKLGPILGGWAGFTVVPRGDGSRATWVEDLTVRYLPAALAPVALPVAKAGIGFSLRRLQKRLRNQRQTAE